MGTKKRQNSKKIIAEILLKWWEKNKRRFSWRRSRKPYNVLISEMLLRKTTAKQVQERYGEFIRKYPNPRNLSKAQEYELSKSLKPLGMEHKRAKLFQKFGKVITEDFRGKVPSSEEELLKLPGVGQYATNAVLSFSHNKNVPMVDTNFIRFIERIFGLKSKKSRARNDTQIWEFGSTLIPKGKSREFNLAVLDFAAILCRARNPKCDICPLTKYCVYYKNIVTTGK